MINLRLLALGTTALLTITACGKNEDAATEAAAEVSATAQSLFAYVPRDTPYLAGNLEPPTDEVIDVFLQRFQPVLNTVQEELHQAREAIEAESPDSTDSQLEPNHDEMPIQLMHAVLQELDGKLNRQGLESLGFDLQSHKVIYGMGVFPVLRVGLSDEKALRESIYRILENAGINASELDHQGIPYWRLSDDDSAGMYVSILDGHLAMSVFPQMAEAELLPVFLGQAMPADSNAVERLAELNARHNYTAFGSGILDLNILLEKFLSPDPILASVIASNDNDDLTEMAPECAAEMRGIISHTPRMTVGITELSSAAVAMQYRVETKSSLAQQLLGLVAQIPAADPLSSRILEFSFGMRFGAVRDFLRNKAAAIVEKPFQCQHLLDINESANQAYEQLNQAMPPFVNNFLGLRLSLSEFTMDQSTTPSAKGLAAVHVDKPEMFIGMAQMMVPDLSELSLVPGEPPVQVPASIIPVPGQVSFAALSKDAIGLSLGAGVESGLISYLEQKPGPAGMFLSASYDMAAYLDYTQNLGKQFQDLDTEGTDPDHAAHYQSFSKIQESAQNAFKAFADRSELTMRFTEDGFETDSRMTFK